MASLVDLTHFALSSSCRYLLFAVVGASFGSTGPVYAQQLQALLDVPPNVAAREPSLIPKRAALQQERNTIRAGIASLNADCSAVNENDTAKIASCTRRRDELAAALSGHSAASEAFNRERERIASIVATPVDSSVVDARNVPSGLPDTVAAAIPDSPAGNRVRRGFQAIMDRDWQVARAWFQDALNQEPGNAGLARLVELAQYMVSPPRPLRLPQDGDLIFLFPGLKPQTTPPPTQPTDQALILPQDSDMQLLFPPLRVDEPHWQTFFNFLYEPPTSQR